MMYLFKSWPVILAGFFVCSALILGGATQSGFAGDITLQLFAAAVCIALLGQQGATDERTNLSDMSLPLFFLGIVCVMFAVQLLPLPTSLARWIAPGAVRELPLRDLVDTPNTISVSPSATWAAAASMLPPMAMFALVARLNEHARLQLCGLILLAGAVSTVMGFAQVMQGPASPLRLFSFTNPTEAVGFFANRNHFAAQIYVTIALAAPWLLAAADNVHASGARRAPNVLSIAGVCVLVLVLIAGLAIARSRAGLILGAASLIGIALISISVSFTKSDGNSSSAKFLTPTRITAAVLVFAALFALQFGFHRIASRFEQDPLRDLRINFTVTTLETALSSMPFGTGIGTFVPTYSVVEKNADIFNRLANRAHNDWAEILLEAGLFSVLLAAIFGIWFVRRSFRVCRAPREPDRPASTIVLQRAAILAILLLLAHSLADYPLRTTAMTTLFAFCCGVLVPARPGAGPSLASHPGRHARTRTRKQPHHKRQSRGQTARPDQQANFDWPAEWRDADDSPTDKPEKAQ